MILDSTETGAPPSALKGQLHAGGACEGHGQSGETDAVINADEQRSHGGVAKIAAEEVDGGNLDGGRRSAIPVDAQNDRAVGAAESIDRADLEALDAARLGGLEEGDGLARLENLFGINSAGWGFAGQQAFETLHGVRGGEVPPPISKLAASVPGS